MKQISINMQVSKYVDIAGLLAGLLTISVNHVRLQTRSLFVVLSA